MVELSVLDENFQIIDIIDDFQSLIWQRSYYDVGSFSLYLTGRYFDLIRRGRYIYRSDAVETGIITGISFTRQGSAPSLTVSGKFLKILLAGRVLDQVQRLRGKHEYVMRVLAETHAMRPDPNRAIPGLYLGQYHDLGSVIDQQATGDNLLDKLHEIGATGELGFRIRFNYLYNQMHFEVYQGLDRTQSQTVNSWATFDMNFENLVSFSYSYQDEDYKNFAYVAGQGEAEERIVVEVDRTNRESRKELYVDARDLNMKKEDDTVMTMDEYRALLMQRGLEKLAEHRKVEAVDSSIDTGANLIYQVDYDLGDKCTVSDRSLGIVLEQRITGIEEVIEGGKQTITPTFGDGMMTIDEKLRREVKK